MVYFKCRNFSLLSDLLADPVNVSYECLPDDIMIKHHRKHNFCLETLEDTTHKDSDTSSCPHQTHELPSKTLRNPEGLRHKAQNISNTHTAAVSFPHCHPELKGDLYGLTVALWSRQINCVCCPY